ncbi:hypothetical protein D9M72_463650 [compost metagenome]
MTGAGERTYAFDRDRRGALAGDLGAHGIEAVGEVDDFGLARGVAQHRGAVCKRRGHHQDVGGADGHLRESVACADQAAFRRRRVDVAAVDLDIGAECLKAFDEQIDRARADGATTGQRYAGLAFTGEQRADHPEACAHLRHQLVRRGRIDDVAAGEMDGAGVALALALAATVDGDVDAVVAEDADQLLDVGQMRHVFERQRVVGQKRRDHQRQGRVLGAGNRDDAVKLVAAYNPDAIHEASRTGLARLSKYFLCCLKAPL